MKNQSLYDAVMTIIANRPGRLTLLQNVGPEATKITIHTLWSSNSQVQITDLRKGEAKVVELHASLEFPMADHRYCRVEFVDSTWTFPATEDSIPSLGETQRTRTVQEVVTYDLTHAQGRAKLIQHAGDFLDGLPAPSETST